MGTEKEREIFEKAVLLAAQELNARSKAILILCSAITEALEKALQVITEITKAKAEGKET